jgi:hypothetical protein
MSPLRIFAGVVVLSVAALVAFDLANLQPAAPHVAAAVASPVMDLGDPATRRAAIDLMSSGAGNFNGEWLGLNCKNDERYEFSRAAIGSFTAQRALFVLDGERGRFHYGVQPLAPSSPMQLGRAWPLSAAEVAKFRSLLHASGYPALPSADPIEGFCHADALTVQSCLGGRYYGVERRCEGAFFDGPKPVSQLLEQVDALMDEVSGGQTRAQLKAISNPGSLRGID